MLRPLFIFCFLLFFSIASGQELGKINNGNHSMTLVQNQLQYSLVYSDVIEGEDLEKSFNFTDKTKLYSILIDGFNDEDHQVFLQTNKDTIIKFSYKRFKGEWMVMIKQENMDTNTKGFSTFFNKRAIQDLFGNP